MNFLDSLNKIAPIIAAIITLGGAVFVAMFTARGIGRIYRQEHTIDLAAKRLAFGDAYMKTALATIGSDDSRRTAIEQEVYDSIQHVRHDVDSQLEELSWRVLLKQNKPLSKTLTFKENIEAIAFNSLGTLSILTGVALALPLIFEDQKHPAGLKITVVVFLLFVSLMVLAFYFLSSAARVKYQRNETIITKV